MHLLSFLTTELIDKLLDRAFNYGLPAALLVLFAIAILYGSFQFCHFMAPLIRGLFERMNKALDSHCIFLTTCTAAVGEIKDEITEHSETALVHQTTDASAHSTTHRAIDWLGSAVCHMAAAENKEKVEKCVAELKAVLSSHVPSETPG